MMLSMNEVIVGMSSIDILDMLRRESCVGGKAKGINIYERSARSVLEQRSFLPVWPPTGREKLPGVAPVEEKVLEVKKEGEGEGSGSGEVDDEGPEPYLPLGTMVDTSYLKLGEILNVRPDVLVTPSVLQPCVKVCIPLFLLSLSLVLNRDLILIYCVFIGC